MTLRAHAVSTLILTLLATLASGCNDTAEDEPNADESAQTGANPLFRETAPWTGRLVLPKPDERRADGAVKIEIHNRSATTSLRRSSRTAAPR